MRRQIDANGNPELTIEEMFEIGPVALEVAQHFAMEMGLYKVLGKDDPMVEELIFDVAGEATCWLPSVVWACMDANPQFHELYRLVEARKAAAKKARKRGARARA